MNVLILINDAPRYINFLKPLGDFFKSKGHKVTYACESHLPEIKYKVSLKGDKAHYFTEFRENDASRKHYKLDVDTNYRRFYYSCYDRNYYHDNNIDKDKRMDIIIQDLLNYFDSIISDEKIDLILYENVSNSFAYAAYELAQKKSIKYYGLITSRIPNRFEIWEDEYGNIENRNGIFIDMMNNTQSEGIFKKELEAANKYLNSFFEKDMKPDYMKGNPNRMDINYFSYYIKKVGLIGKYLKYYYSFHNEVRDAYQSSYPIRASYYSILRSIKRKIRIQILKNLYDKPNKDNDNYLIYPMHFQPESSTSVNAMYYDNQYEAIKNIVFSLPLGMSLYVKDHPNGIGCQNMDFYKKLKRLPNVKYINPLISTKELISSSKGVITLTSTMGYEALLMNKPVLVLGKVFYSYHPYCYSISSYSEIHDKVVCALKMDHERFKEYNLFFLSTYFYDTYEGEVFKEDADLRSVYDSICSRISKV